MADFNFIGDAYEAPSRYANDQELINWYLEIDQRKGPGERGAIAMYPTPGLTLKATLPSSVARGFGSLPGGTTFLAVYGQTLYLIASDFTHTTIGTLLSNTGPVSITNNGVEAYIVDGNNRYSYVIATKVLTTIASTDGAFTGGVRCDIVDNYIVYNRPNSQEWAATDSISTTTQALSFASKFGSSDNLIALWVQNRYVYLLGQLTSEVWIDTGGFPFPFQIIPGTSMMHGCAAPFSLTRLGEFFAFVSVDDRGQAIIVQMNGYSPRRISTYGVENDLVGQTISDCIAFTYQIEGHEFAVFIFPAADKTWVYDLSSNKWHKWLSVDAYNVFHRHRANCGIQFQGQFLVGDYQNGNLYALDRTVYTDNGTTIRRVRRCPHLLQDLQRVFYEELQIQFQPGTALATGQGSNPQAILRWSDDGGSTWSTEHWASIGSLGSYMSRVMWRRMGWARDRIYELVVSDPINPVIVSANIKTSGSDN